MCSETTYLQANGWKEIYISLWVHEDFPRSCVDTNYLYPVYRVDEGTDRRIGSLSKVIRG